MQNELKIIRQQEVLGKDFKIYGNYENPLFLAKDVAEWIEYNVSSLNKMLNNVDGDEKIKLNLGRNNLPRQVLHGGIRENTDMWFLTEDGLYEVLMQSRKPIAKAFKKEVKEILKSIRKTGGYIKEELVDKLLQSEKTAAQYLELLRKEYRKNEALIELSEMITPQAHYCNVILKGHNSIPVSVISKDYGMSAVKFNKLLHACGVQYKVCDTWVLYSKHDNHGFTETITYEKGGYIISVTTNWTQKGRKFIYDTLKKHGILPEIERQYKK